MLVRWNDMGDKLVCPHEGHSLAILVKWVIVRHVVIVVTAGAYSRIALLRGSAMVDFEQHHRLDFIQ